MTRDLLSGFLPGGGITVAAALIVGYRIGVDMERERIRRIVGELRRRQRRTG